MSKIKYTHNNQFFFDDSIITCYWIGFIAADGCLVKVSNKNSYRLQLRIHNKDKNHLEQFKSDIAFTGNIIKHSDSSVAIYITLDLNEYNYLQEYWFITPAKSLTLKPPTHLTFEQSLAYIKGYIDGDGSTKLTKYKRFNYQILGTPAILQWIANLLNISNTIRPKNKIWQIDVTGETAYRTGKLIQASVSRELHRKWSKLDSSVHVAP